MSKRYFLLLGCIFTLLTACTSGASSGDGHPSEDIIKAAKEGIQVFFNNSKSEDLSRLGVKSKAQVASTDLGYGFQIYTIQPDNLQQLINETISKDYQSYLTPTNQWQFLVTDGINAYSLLTVDSVNGEWTPVSMGSSELAKELGQVLSTWPESSGYQYRFIVVYQAKSEFVELSQNGKVLGFIPMTSLLAAISDNSAYEFDPRDLRDPIKVLQALKPVVSRNI